MALTNLSQITTSGISTLADVSLNSITGVDATFTGNVSIGGTLTYDDVTNIDSVGLITARSGLRVLTGTATTALVVEGDARITGILTVGTSSLTLNGSTNVVNVGTALTLGHTQGLQFHTQNLHSQGFDVNNVNATGIITATTFSGALSGTASNASNASGATGDFSVADKIVHTDDTNTAIRFPAADTISFETGGGERLRITSAGNVGINKDAPTSVLDVRQTNTGAATEIKLFNLDQSNATTQTAALVMTPDVRANGVKIIAVKEVADMSSTANKDLALTFQTVANNTAEERLRIDSAGKLGIGIPSPAYLAHIHNAGTGTGDHAYLHFTTGDTGSTGSDGLTIGVGANETAFINYRESGPLVLATSGTEKLRISSNGKIGIDNNSPDHKFSIYDAGYCGLELKSNRSSSADNIGGLHFKTQSTNVAYIQSLVDGTVKIRNTSSLTERLRIDSSGRLLLACTTPPNTDVNAGLQIQHTGTANITLARDDSSITDGNALGRIDFYGNDGGTFEHCATIAAQADGAHANGDKPMRLIFGTSSDGTAGTPTERLRIDSSGQFALGRTGQITMSTGNKSNSVFEQLTNAYYPLALHSNETNKRGLAIFYADTGAGGNGDPFLFFENQTSVKFQVFSNGLVSAGAGHFTQNLTPTSGRGVEIFEASAGVGLIQSYNRTGTSFDELRLRGSEVSVYCGTTQKLYVQSASTNLYGTTDGVFNIDTTDGRGAFIRFKENGTTKTWVGCSEGIGTGGDQDDLGLRAVGGFRVRTGNSNRIEISDEGQILFRPITGGFTTSGAAGTFPGAAVAIDCHGIGPGTGTNIPQYGLYVDAVGSSNDATLMTGIFAISKQNVENAAIGVHGLYERDWSSYVRKIGGLFQAPARATRYSTLSMNPGGGNFMNTTDTGHANKLASGGTRPDGNADGSATYGDCTALWGDVFRSDTDTSSEQLRSVAIKATNRTTHALQKVGLMVGIVDGNDGTANRKKTHFVEYYANSNYQRYYARNHRKEVNQHYPMSNASTDGSMNTLWNIQTGKYYIQNIIGLNQYSWYYFNCYAASYARNGRLKLDIAWTTAHAAGAGEGSYCVLYTIHHGDQKAVVRRFTRFHQYQVGGSYYGWYSSPHLDIFQSTSTGSSAGIYLRVRGHVQNGSFDAYGMHSIRLEADENTYGFPTESSFRFVGNSTPSDADTSTGAITISAPTT